ncbi:MAG: hypothetical protein J6A59_02915 [Lachnospiraceae bacterium]|nr:hypothetical protein [Lachnospiraceae bacterium]
MIGVIFLIIGLACGVYGIKYFRQHGFLWERKLETEEKEPKRYSIFEDTSDKKYGGMGALVVSVLFLVLGAVVLIRTLTGHGDISIEGIDISLPCTYLDIQSMGFDIEEGQEIEEIKGTTSSYNRHGATYTVVDDKGRRFEVRFENDDEEDKLATSCNIYELRFEYAPPNNIYDDMQGYGALYNSWQYDLEMTPEEREQAQERYNSMIEEKQEYYDNYEILDSPDITLGNNVNSDMTRLEVEAILGAGKSPIVSAYTSEYYATREYYMSTGGERLKITITYLTKDEIAKIRISQ